MLLMKDILDEKDKRLREVSKEVQFPLSDEKKKIINDMVEFLTNSQIPELAEKYDLRPGMGLAAIQIGIPERFFVVVNEYDEGQFETYVIINPKIISNSEERIYVEMLLQLLLLHVHVSYYHLHHIQKLLHEHI